MDTTVLIDSYVRGFMGHIDRVSEAQPALVRSKHAVEGVHRTWREIYETHHRRMGDESLLPAARLKSSASFAKQRLSAALTRVAMARNGVTSELGAVRARLNDHLRQPSSPGEASRDSEIRRHFHACNSSQRIKLLAQARINDDVVTLRAIASAPAYLSGVDDTDHDRARHEFLSRVAPEDMRLEGEYSSALHHLEKSHHGLQEHVNRLIDFQRADRAEEVSA